MLEEVRERLTKLEGSVGDMGQRLGGVEERLNSMVERQARLEGFAEQLSQRVGHLESVTKELRTLLYGVWGTVVLMWVTVILTIIFKD